MKSSTTRSRVVPDIAGTPSRLLRHAVEDLGADHRNFLDLACGFGRNALYLASRGASGIAVDVDEARTFAAYARLVVEGLDGRVVVRTEAELDFLSACRSSFDLVVCTDYWRPRLLLDLSRVVSPGGWLVLHTPTARGTNWRGLPERNDAMRDVVACGLEIVECRLAQPKGSPTRVALNLVGRLRR